MPAGMGIPWTVPFFSYLIPCQLFYALILYAHIQLRSRTGTHSFHAEPVM